METPGCYWRVECDQNRESNAWLVPDPHAVSNSLHDTCWCHEIMMPVMPDLIALNPKPRPTPPLASPPLLSSHPKETKFPRSQLPSGNRKRTTYTSSAKNKCLPFLYKGQVYARVQVSLPKQTPKPSKLIG